MNLHKEAIRLIKELKPGQQINFSGEWGESYIDDALEEIVGSGYEFGYTQHENYYMVFRLKEPLPSESALRSYVSPDRKQYYNQQPNGLYKRNELPY